MEKGKVLKKRRIDLGLTLDDLAQRTGINRATINRYENVQGAADSMNLENARAISQNLYISPLYLMGLSDSLDTPELHEGLSRKINLYESVAAGEPIEANTESMDTVDVPTRFIDSGYEYIVLKVKGDSMYPDFQDGDEVLVRLQSDCESGQVAVVYVNGYNATLKKLVKNDDRSITLYPRNPEYVAKTYGPEDDKIGILGVVTELFRKV